MALRGDIKGAERQRRYRTTEKGRLIVQHRNNRANSARALEKHTWTREQWKEYREYRRGIQFKSRYNITLADYEVMLDRQNRHCALCPRTPAQERYGRLNVDHCHETGRVRGLLCTPCNHALGVLGDNLAGLQRACAYLDD